MSLNPISVTLARQPKSKKRPKFVKVLLSYSEYTKALQTVFTKTQREIADFIFLKLSLHPEVFLLEKTIANACGCSVKTVSNTITLLRYYELISTQQRFGRSMLFYMGFYFKRINNRFSLMHIFPSLGVLKANLLLSKNISICVKSYIKVITSYSDYDDDDELDTNRESSYTRTREGSSQYQNRNLHTETIQRSTMDKKRRLLEGYLTGKIQELPIMEEVKALRLPYSDNQILELQVFSVPILAEASKRMQKIKKTGNTFAYFKATCRGIAAEKHIQIDEEWLTDLNSLWSDASHFLRKAQESTSSSPSSPALQSGAPQLGSAQSSPQDSKEKNYTANTPHGTKRLRSLDEKVQAMTEAVRHRFLDVPWKELHDWERVDITEAMNRERRLFDRSSPMMQLLEKRREADSTDAELMARARKVYFTVNVPWKVLDEWLLEYSTHRTICGKFALRETIFLLRVYLEERDKIIKNSRQEERRAPEPYKNMGREQKLNPESDLSEEIDPLEDQAELFSERYQ